MCDGWYLSPFKNYFTFIFNITQTIGWHKMLITHLLMVCIKVEVGDETQGREK